MEKIEDWEKYTSENLESPFDAVKNRDGVEIVRFYSPNDSVTGQANLL